MLVYGVSTLYMEKCIFVGYPEGYKSWLFWNPVTKRLVICERTDFDECYNWNNHPLTSPSPIWNAPTNNTNDANDNGNYVPLHHPDDNDNNFDNELRIVEVPPEPALAPALDNNMDDLKPNADNDPKPNSDNDDGHGNDNNNIPSSSSSDKGPANLLIVMQREPQNRKPPGE